MMSDEMLSQDEIDALLRGTEDDTVTQTYQNEEEEYLSPIEKDALGEIGNISFGSASTALSTLLNQKVEITTPTVTVIKKENVSDEFPVPYVGIQVSYTQGFTGSNLLIMQLMDAAIIVDLMLGGDGSNPSELMDEIHLSAVQEAMNQMMGSAATSMSTVFNKRVDISPPSIEIIDIQHGQGMEKIPNKDLLVKISFRLKVGNLIDSSIMQLIPLDFSINLVGELLNPGQVTNAQSPVAKQEQSRADSTYTRPDRGSSAIDNQGANAFNQNAAAAATVPFGYSAQVQVPFEQPVVPFQQQSAHHMGTRLQGLEQPNIQPAIFSNFDQQQPQVTETKNLDMLLDIPLHVTVELGSTKKSVKEILELSAGSIIELDKLAGEPVDILVNNRLVAQGEVVVIDENFGVRVTDIISQSDRLKKLR
jgi:flagellar motor switch protein FliN/FliY